MRPADDARAAFAEAVETGYWPELPEEPAPRAAFFTASESGVPIRVRPGMPILVEAPNDVAKQMWLESEQPERAALLIQRSVSFDRLERAFHPEPWLDLNDPVVRAVLGIAAAFAIGYLVL